MVNKWGFAALLALGMHFAASYLVPLDQPSQRTFGGLLRWVWPWSDGDGGPLGRVTVAAGFPLVGFAIAMGTVVLLLLAALAVTGFGVPFRWWRLLVGGGAGLSVVLMVLFFGPTKLLPLGFDLALLYVALARPAILATA